MIHTKQKDYFIYSDDTDESIKKTLVIDMIVKMPMSELEKMVKFEKFESIYPGYKKMRATIELIDV